MRHGFERDGGCPRGAARGTLAPQPCLVCGEAADGGVRVLGRRLCDRCQEMIAGIDARDRRYDVVVARLRDAWRPFLVGRA